MRKLYRLSGIAMNAPWFGERDELVRLYWETSGAEYSGSEVELLERAQDMIDELEEQGFVVTSVGHP